MSLYTFNDESINITFSNEYTKAIFGNLHIVFVNKNNEYFIPIENKQALINSIWFYKNVVSKYITYPFFDGDAFINASPSDKRVINQILGLPKELFNNLDIDEDIISQLNFKDNLSILKKECYSLLYSKYDKKWHIDDFKLFLINHGFYFIYDETKPFIASKDNSFKVHINEKLFLDETKGIISTLNSDRYIIDYCNDNINEKMIEEFKKLDDFSFSELIDYFINEQKNEKIDLLILNDEFKIQFKYILKNVLTSIINLLFDYYSFNVLNKVSRKLSFLSIQSLNIKNNIYSLSSFYFETYSYNKKDWYIALIDKERLLKRYKLLKDNEKKNNIILFSKIGLPFVLFKYIKDKKINNEDDFINSFSYIDLPYSLLFQSAKRGDLYSYLLGGNKHLLITLKRELSRRGIKYSTQNPFEKSTCFENNTIEININKNHVELFDLVSNPTKELHKDLYLIYLLNNNDISSSLRDKLKVIDIASNSHALYEFYNSFNNISIKDNLKRLLTKYGLDDLYSSELLDYFFFLFSHPFDVVYLQVRKHLYENNDIESLLAIEIKGDDLDTYEPNLPYPHVYFGKVYYSFRKTFLSEPFIAKEYEESIKERENFYKKIANVIYKGDKYYKEKTKSFLKRHIGLPDNISASIDFNKSITKQINFKENISHLSLKAEPLSHNNINYDKEALYNIYSSYIIAEASKYGLYTNNLIFDENYVTYHLIEEIENDSYHGIINIDRSKIKPILNRYLDFDSSSLYALLLSFFTNEFIYYSPCYDLISFVKEDKNIINQLLFEKIDDESFYIFHMYFFLFTMLAYIYKGVELSYAINISTSKIPELITSPYTLNIDYQPKLPLPYVHLGRVFNAYSYDENSNDFYFCSCDKESILGLIKKIYKLLLYNSSDEIITPLTLSFVGLPYVVVKKYADINFKIMSPEHFVDNLLKFKDNICRRCKNIPHAAYKEPFIKAFPHKENNEAEYYFANNTLAHNHLILMPSIPLSSIKYDSNYKYELNSFRDVKIPNFIFFNSQPSKDCYTFFNFTNSKLREYLKDFLNRSTKIEIVVLASGVILDAYSRNNEIFYNFIFLENDKDTLIDKVMHTFPEIERNRKEIIEPICQSILGFITFLIEKYIEDLVKQERKIGE